MKRLHTKLQNKNKGKAPYVRVLCTRFTPYVTDYYSPFKVIHTNQQGTPDHIWFIQGCMRILGSLHVPYTQSGSRKRCQVKHKTSIWVIIYGNAEHR